MNFISHAEVIRVPSVTGQKVNIHFDFELARLVANATPEILDEMVRREAASILMNDPKLKERIHELALSHLITLSEKAVPPAQPRYSPPDPPKP